MNDTRYYCPDCPSIWDDPVVFVCSHCCGAVAETTAWTQTASGGRFYPMAPRPSEIRIEDIATGLANACRFGSQTPVFFSVAQHSVEVSRMVSEECRPLALLHDAAEAYLGDIPRPYKELLSYNDVVELEREFLHSTEGVPAMLTDEQETEAQMIAGKYLVCEECEATTHLIALEFARAIVRDGRGLPRCPRLSFFALWDSINAKSGHGWATNPTPVVLNFRGSEGTKAA